jgi:signal transduction histidine kinase
MRKPDIYPLRETIGDLTQEVRKAERRGIAIELHDTVMQPLSALLLGLEGLQQSQADPDEVERELNALKALAHEAIESLRDTLAGLRTHPHAHYGLPEAVRRYLAPPLEGRGLHVNLAYGDWPGDLPLDLTTGLYLAVREALTNAERHASANQVTVLLRAHNQDLYITIIDDGVGFRPTSKRASSHTGGMGIAGMRQRVRDLGGSMTITSVPGEGTHVDIRVPIPAADVVPATIAPQTISVMQTRIEDHQVATPAW